MAKRPRPRIRVGISAPRGAKGSLAAADRALQQSLGDVLQGFQNFVAHMENVTPEVLLEALEPTFKLSQEIVPVDSGKLKESGFLEIVGTRTKPVVAMGYARGGQPDYALYVHEVPYEHAPPTQWKYLQGPLDENYFGILSNLPKLLREAAGT